MAPAMSMRCITVPPRMNPERVRVVGQHDLHHLGGGFRGALGVRSITDEDAEDSETPEGIRLGVPSPVLGLRSSLIVDQKS